MNRRERRAARGRGPGRAGPAPGVGEVLRRALALHQAGELDRAATLYKKALAREPDNPAARHLYGLLLHHAGDHDGAAAEIGRALDGDPDNALFRNHMAQALGALERWEEAENQLRRALELRPDFAEARNNLGNVLDGAGRLEAAADEFRAALGLNPQFAEAHGNLGTILAKLGRLDDAAAEYQKALALNPGFAEAHNNLGNVLLDRGEAAAAADQYRRALDATPDFADAHRNLGGALSELGRPADATGHYLEALALDPDCEGARSGLVSVLRRMVPRSYRAGLDAVLADCLGAAEVRADDISRVAARHLSLKYGWPTDRADAAAVGFEAEALDALADDPLFLAFLRAGVNTDPAMEAVLTRLRRVLLMDRPDAPLALVAALARQCLNNEHVFAAGADEARIAAELAAEIASGGFDPPPEGAGRKLALLALYRPLHTLAERDAIAAVPPGAWPEPVAALLEDAVLARIEEAEIAAALPAVGSIGDDVSAAVAAQYEENPYPRWLSVPHRERESPAAVMKRRFPHLVPPDFLHGPVDVLVAGCGTGQHPIADVALAYHDCTVLGVDLSRASLACASRMARGLGVGNIEFMQADILNLGALDRRFHMIECAGVLHHMAEPAAGWRVLLDLLAPGGLMMVALYSELARSAIAAARDRIAGMGIGPAAADIVAFRQTVLDGGAGGDLASLASWADFYSVSGCRDLVFHAQEHRFTLPRLAALLDELELEFIGFEFPDDTVPRRYRAANPGDPTMTDLDAWDAFEHRHQDTFGAMYSFWCRRKPDTNRS